MNNHAQRYWIFRKFNSLWHNSEWRELDCLIKEHCTLLLGWWYNVLLNGNIVLYEKNKFYIFHKYNFKITTLLSSLFPLVYTPVKLWVFFSILCVILWLVKIFGIIYKVSLIRRNSLIPPKKLGWLHRCQRSNKLPGKITIMLTRFSWVNWFGQCLNIAYKINEILFHYLNLVAKILPHYLLDFFKIWNGRSANILKATKSKRIKGELVHNLNLKWNLQYFWIYQRN